MQSRTQSKRAAVSKKRRAGSAFSVVLLTILILAAIGAAAYGYYILNLETFYTGVVVDNVELGGMTYAQGLKTIMELRQPELDAINILLHHEDLVWEFDYQDIGAEINIEEVIDQAYQVGRQGNVFQRLKQIYEAGKTGYSFNTVLTYDVSLLQDDLSAIARQINLEPVDAQIEFNPDNEEKFTFTEEVIGKGMRVEEALSDLKEKVDNRDFSPYEIPVQIIQPKYTLEEVKTWTSKIAVYSTPLTSSAPRTHNIILSSKSYDGLRLDPGQVFSLNEATGPRDREQGYKDAPVIKQGKKLVDEPGGGNCQTSTTIYGAAIRADLEIIERWHHSWPSAYAAVGQDATVSYPELDIKIRNNKDTPVFFDRYIYNGRLYVEVYGKAPTEYDKIDVISVVLEQTSKPEEKVIQDNTLGPGEEVVEYQSRPGIKVQTYRVYYKDGKEIKRVKEAYSNYPRIVGQKRVGPPKPPENEEQQSDNDTSGNNKPDEKPGSNEQNQNSSGEGQSNSEPTDESNSNQN
jgi:vancomycin resistance protein YoaR